MVALWTSHSASSGDCVDILGHRIRVIVNLTTRGSSVATERTRKVRVVFAGRERMRDERVFELR
jgi:hypothetical protein